VREFDCDCAIARLRLLVSFPTSTNERECACSFLWHRPPLFTDACGTRSEPLYLANRKQKERYSLLAPRRFARTAPLDVYNLVH